MKPPRFEGRVSLVGSGPGDPELMTIRAQKRINQADIIIHDRLVGQRIIPLLPKKAEKIDASKRSGKHRIPQEKINRMIVEKAREGKKVVRLKGGDPFLFGRGGEEASYLIENGVEFEVVPGVTSAISIPALAGIPVTHRDYASSVTIITGHRTGGRKTNWKALTELGGTLIILMGISNLQYNMSELISSGLATTTPAALIENGSQEGQRVLISTVEKISDLAQKEGAKPPGVIVVGDVVGLHGVLHV